MIREQGQADSKNGTGGILHIPERVAQLYYSHGLYISRHPVINICLTIVVVLFVCYPLCYYPLDGSISQQFAIPFENFTTPPLHGVEEKLNQFLESDTESRWPLWYSGEPVAYVQQVIVKGVVSPWRDDLIITDAFKGPLSKVFRLFEAVSSFQDEHSGKTLSDLCLHVNSPTIRDSPLPEYNCFIVSPASFWKQDLQNFLSDGNFLSTVMSGQVGGEWHTTLSDILLGVPRKESGLVWFPGKLKPRVLTYAITVVMRTFDREFLEAFHSELSERYGTPLDNNLSEVVHLYYPSSLLLKELTPLIVTYCAIFTYFYFSVRKCDMVKSQFGMAVSAVATSLASLCCAVSLCSCFGFSFSLNGKFSHQAFPYLVSVVCLENSMVLTRAVHSTQAHLDVKIRVAKGLSREGWSITKNLLVEILVITLGIFSFIPVLQELCIFAVVALVCDFLIQMYFFATVLSVDIRRMELSDVQRQQEQILRSSCMLSQERIQRPVPHHNTPRKYSQYPMSLVAPSFGSPIVVQLPKRLRVLYFWSKWRMLQRLCFLFLFLSIPFLLYKPGLYDQLFGATPSSLNSTANITEQRFSKITRPPDKGGGYHPRNVTIMANGSGKGDAFNTTYDTSFSARDAVMWKKLPPGHWPALFSYYNMSLSGRYITVLPPLLLSVSINPDETVGLRHPKDADRAARWPSWMEGREAKFDESSEDGPFVPKSTLHMVGMAFVVAPSLAITIYMVLVLYRCMCSRHYAEWRTSWNNEEDTTEVYTQVMMDSVPLVLSGHNHEVENLVVDGCYIVSCCLAGHLRVWDANTGECLQLINRHSSVSYSPWGSMKVSAAKTGGEASEGSSDTEHDHDGTESGSPPHLRMRGLNTESPEVVTFTLPRASSDSVIEKKGYDFSPFVTPRLEDLEQHECRNVFEESFAARNKEQQRVRTVCPIHPVNGMSSPVPSNSMCRCPPHRTNHKRNWSVDSGQGLSPDVEANNRNPVWCLYFLEGLIVVGCGRGQIEFWDSETGELMEVFSDGSEVGVTSLQLVGNRLVVARLSGALDFFELRGFSPYISHREESTLGSRSLTAVRLHTTRAHQQPISVMDCQGGRVVTGSQDHTIKVHRLEDAYCLFTLHGHFGPITALFIDKLCPVMACTGSQDGSLALWDLESGTCVYRVSAHDGTVCSLTYTASYVISLGMDAKICVWERFQGHLLNTLEVQHSSCTAMMMLTDNLLITTKQGTLLLWDLTSGATQPVRDIRLGNVDESTFIKQMVPMPSAGRLLVDYGRDLRVLSFPVFTSKTE